jgi:hypothetical protein
LSQFAEGWRWRFPAADADKDWLLAPFQYYKLSERYDILPHALEQADPTWRGMLVGKLRAESTFIVGGPSFPDWLRTTTEETHSLQFVVRGDSYFIAVFTRRSVFPQRAKWPKRPERLKPAAVGVDGSVRTAAPVEASARSNEMMGSGCIYE